MAAPEGRSVTKPGSTDSGDRCGVWSGWSCIDWRAGWGHEV